jgi:hypothetical protein
VEEQVVHLVGEDELLDLDPLLAESPDQAHGLAEGNVPVVVAMDEKDGRAPAREVYLLGQEGQLRAVRARMPA